MVFCRKEGKSAALLLSLLLCACMTPPKAPETAMTGAVAAENAVNEANASYKAGQTDKAVTLFKSAAGMSPTDKTPWLRMAQIKFDSGNYGEAIMDANEALQRDPKDKIA